MDRQSTILLDGFTSNPFYDPILDLLSNEQQFDDLQAYLASFIDSGITTADNGLPLVDENSIIASILNDSVAVEKIDGLVDRFFNVEQDVDNVPPPPKASGLYSRVGEVAILDVGSGTGNKAGKCRSDDIRMVDLLPRSPAVEKFDCTDPVVFKDLVDDRIITSFNSLTQLDNVEHIFDYDGLHVVPDLDVFFKVGLSTIEAKNGRDRYTTIVNGQTFLEYKIGIGDVHHFGYRHISCYKERKVDVRVTNLKAVSTGFSNQVEDVEYPLLLDSTRKYNGKCVMLSCQGGKGVLKNRSGFGVRVLCDTDMVLMLEKMPLDGRADFFVVFRVVMYRNYYPFHGTWNLDNFAQKVKISIGGVPVLGPSNKRRCLDDGLIYRIGEVDYRFKEHVTFDIQKSCHIKSMLESDGIAVRFDQECVVLSEYLVKVQKDYVEFVFLRVRTDKNDATDYNKIRNYLQVRM